MNDVLATPYGGQKANPTTTPPRPTQPRNCLSQLLKTLPVARLHDKTGGYYHSTQAGLAGGLVVTARRIERGSPIPGRHHGINPLRFACNRATHTPISSCDWGLRGCTTKQGDIATQPEAGLAGGLLRGAQGDL
jgi:hypothetical protein